MATQTQTTAEAKVAQKRVTFLAKIAKARNAFEAAAVKLGGTIGAAMVANLFDSEKVNGEWTLTKEGRKAFWTWIQDEAQIGEKSGLRYVQAWRVTQESPQILAAGIDDMTPLAYLDQFTHEDRLAILASAQASTPEGGKITEAVLKTHAGMVLDSEKKKADAKDAAALNRKKKAAEKQEKETQKAEADAVSFLTKANIVKLAHVTARNARNADNDRDGYLQVLAAFKLVIAAGGNTGPLAGPAFDVVIAQAAAAAEKVVAREARKQAEAEKAADPMETRNAQKAAQKKAEDEAAANKTAREKATA